LKSAYPNSVILGPRKWEKLEDLVFFKKHINRKPLNFLVFDIKNKKIVGVEVIKLRR
jgi:hypothetical protein